MKLSAEWLHTPETAAVMQALQAHGNQAFFVGGCVRNALLGVPTTDVDISTDARPEQIISLAKAAGLKPVPTGIDHGTITIVTENEAFEVTCFRKDIETDGRRAVVAFSNDIQDDARRRDFTMNAIYAQSDGTVVDPLNGLPDLQRRHVKFIEDPDQRIAEDYLRILRFFRFTAQYGDPDLGIDADGLAACAKGVDGIEALAKERIGAEMRKILAVSDPSRVLSAMDQSGILLRILTGATAKYIPILVHIEQFEQIDWITRLVVLGGSNQTDSLRLSKADSGQLRHVLKAIETGARPNALAFEYGRKVAVSSALALAALTETTPPVDLEDQVETGLAAEFPIQAKDLEHLQGKELGDALRSLRERWIASDFKLDKQGLLP
jgi:poly(A) polymerase